MNGKPVIENIDRCIADAKNGDMKAFEALVSQYQSYVYALAFRFFHDREAAGEIVQECFIRIWKNISSFDGKNKFSTWLYTIVVNLCYDRTKSEKRRNRIFAGPATELPDTGNGYLEKEYNDREMMELVRTMADDLSEKQRMVFLLRDIENLSVKEVSEIACMSESSVKANLCFARKNIRLRLLKLEGQHEL